MLNHGKKGFPCKVCSFIDSALTSTKFVHVHIDPFAAKNNLVCQQSSKSEQVGTNAVLVLHHYTQTASQLPNVSTIISQNKLVPTQC